jgi:hypothetical protein
MLRFVARVLIARQHDLCRTAWGAPEVHLADRFPGPVDRSSQEVGILRTPTNIPSTCGLLVGRGAIIPFCWRGRQLYRAAGVLRTRSLQRERSRSEAAISAGSRSTQRPALWQNPGPRK